jgi:prevent-host-death family protein
MTTRKKRPASKSISFLLLQQRQIGAAEFKAHCLEIMDEVERLGIDVVITKHRKPVARLSPYAPKRKSIVGSLKGMVLIEGDIVSPTGEIWTADESNLT